MRGELDVAVIRKLDAIVQELCSDLTDEEIAELIKRVDEHRSNWDMTEELYEYFSGEHELYSMSEELDDEDDEDDVQRLGNITIDGR